MTDIRKASLSEDDERRTLVPLTGHVANRSSVRHLRRLTQKTEKNDRFLILEFEATSLSAEKSPKRAKKVGKNPARRPLGDEVRRR